jgi:DNA-binding transcriptional ArsR family regulator
VDTFASVFGRHTVADRARAERRNPSGIAFIGQRCILNYMVQYPPTALDASFAALSDATRRGVLQQLGQGDASITELAEEFGMTLTGMRKHVRVLEGAHLVVTRKVGRVRTCSLGPGRLSEARAWMERYRQMWEARFHDLETVVEDLKRKERTGGHNGKD